MSDDRVWWPGDREMVDRALVVAREAGVPESVIQRLLVEARDGPQDSFVTPVLAGKLGYAARKRAPARPAGVVPFTAQRERDPW